MWIILCNAEYPWLLRMCRSLGNREQGDDLAQEAMATACGHSGSLRDREAFRPWLRAIARHKLADWFRRRQSERAALGGGAEGVVAAADLSPTGERVDLQEAIGELPEEQRTAVVLRYFTDLRYREIAAVVGCPIGTVMPRLYAARVRLQRLLRTRVLRGNPEAGAGFLRDAELDRQLRDWGSAVDETPKGMEYGRQERRGPAAWVTAYPLQTLVWPAALAGMALCLVSLRYGLDGLYRMVAVALARLGPMP